MTEPQPEIEQPQPNQELPPAYFSSLEVENVLCFKTRQKLNLCGSNGLPAQWTVILGDNGVGKTTLLRCLAGMEPYPRFNPFLLLGTKESQLFQFSKIKSISVQKIPC